MLKRYQHLDSVISTKKNTRGTWECGRSSSSVSLDEEPSTGELRKLELSSCNCIRIESPMVAIKHFFLKKKNFMILSISYLFLLQHFWHESFASDQRSLFHSMNR